MKLCHHRAMFQWRAQVCALGLAAVVIGCRESGVQSCQDLIEKSRYEQAAKRCAEVYAAEGDDRAGASAVLAHYSLGHETEVLSWVDRLAKDGKIRPGVWSLAAIVHEQRGEAEAAERKYRSDLALYQAAGHHQRAADTLNRLSDLSWHMSRYRQAFLFASQALEEAVKAKDRELEARSAEALYNVLYAVGDLPGARQALERAREIGIEDNQEGRARLLANQGNMLADQGRFALARRDLEQALIAGSGSSHQQTLRTIRLNLTDVYLTLGDIDRAARHLEEAWKHVEPDEPRPVSLLYYRARVDLVRGRPADAAQILTTALSQDPAPDWAWDLEYQRGRAEESRGDLKAAEAAYEKSIGIIEEMRRSLAFDELKTWLLDRKRQPFEALFYLQARSGRAEEALATVERAQARTLLDAFLHAHSAEGGSPGAPWSPDVAAARMGDLELLLPVMSESPVVAPQPIHQVLLAFGDRHGLVYFEAGEDLWLIVVARGEIQFHSLAAPVTEIRRLVERFIAHPEDAGVAGRLGEILLPSGSLPEEGRTLHIVADGILGNLPFAALKRGDRHLIEDHAIALIPSLSVLAALESQSVEPLGPPLVLADSRGNLPAAALEGREVAKLLAAELRTAGAATSRELEKATRARSLHLATHTGLSSRGPWLLLADRRLGTAEIVTRRIGPRLVVLASCASGARTGRQMWGSLGAAFLAAGSRAVLASLWSVEDKPARDFVLRFYAEGGASDPAGALARTQCVAIQRGQSPNLWASFVLFGSDRRLN